MPYYYKREINDLNGTGKTQYRYEVRSEGRVGLDYLAHVVQRRHRALSEGEVYGIVSSTIDALTSALAEGHSVTLDGLGNFSVGIGLIDRTSMRRRWGFPDIPSALAGEETEEGEAEPNARSIGVRTVHFKASPDLIGEVDRRCKLKREPSGAAHIRQSPYTREERIHRVLVAEVHPHQRHLPPENGADALVIGFVAIGEVVGDHDVIAGLGQLHGHVASDESGSAGHEYGFLHIVVVSLVSIPCTGGASARNCSSGGRP